MGKIISLVSGKGGVGKTTISINLAYLLAKERLETLLIDGNITSSQLFLYLKKDVRPTFSEILKKWEKFSSIYEWKDNLFVLPSRFVPSKIYMRRIKRTLEKLKGMFEYVIVDAGCGFGDDVLKFIDASDLVLGVSTPTLMSILDLIRLRSIAKLKDLKFVLNMVGLNGFKVKEVERILKKEVFHTLPYDKKVEEANSMGELVCELFPKTKFSKQMKKLAYKLLYRP